MTGQPTRQERSRSTSTDVWTRTALLAPRMTQQPRKEFVLPARTDTQSPLQTRVLTAETARSRLPMRPATRQETAIATLTASLA